MKKSALLFAGLFFTIYQSLACDLCSIYMNFEPNDLKNSFGINYRQRVFENKFKQNGFSSFGREKHGAGETVVTSTNKQTELYRAYDLWFNYFVNHDWQINASVSFSDNYYKENDSTLYNISGPGDLTVVARRFILNRQATDSNAISFRWLAGGGVKIPIGIFNKSHTVIPRTESKGNVVFGTPFLELDPHLQPGTGSLDFIFLTEFQMRHKKTGLSSSISYRINTANSNNFRFANRFNTNFMLFQLLSLGKKKQLAPNFGLNYEFAERDRFKDEDFLDSGGSTLFLSVGMKLYLGSIAVGAAYYDPIYQNLYDHQIQNKNRVTADLSYYF